MSSSVGGALIHLTLADLGHILDLTVGYCGTGSSDDDDDDDDDDGDDDDDDDCDELNI